MGRHKQPTHMQVDSAEDGASLTDKRGHIIQSGPNRKLFLSSCGQVIWYTYNITTEPSHVTCADCSKAEAAAAMKLRPPSAPALTLQNIENHGWAYRYAYKAFIETDFVAYVCFEGAFGATAWRVCKISLEAPEARFDHRIGSQLTGGKYDKPLDWGCKELALLAVESFFAEGRLQTIDQMKAAKAAALTRHRERQLVEAADRSEEEQRLDRATESITELVGQIAAGTVKISNQQREALDTALDVIRRRRKSL